MSTSLNETEKNENKKDDSLFTLHVPVCVTILIPIKDVHLKNPKYSGEKIGNIDAVDLSEEESLGDIVMNACSNKQVINCLEYMIDKATSYKLAHGEITIAVTPFAGIVPETIY